MVLDREKQIEDLTVRDITEITKRIYKKKVAAIMIDGMSGEGKTTLAVRIAKVIEPDFMENEKYKSRIGLGGSDFMRKANEVSKDGSEKVRVVIYDESGDYNKKRVMSNFNHHMGRFFDTYRSSRILPIIIHTSFRDLDPSTLMEKGIIRGLYHCEKRERTIGYYRAYSLNRMWYIIEKMRKLTIPQHAYSYTDPNYYGCFKDLEESESKALETYCNGGKIEIRDKALEIISGQEANPKDVENDDLITVGDMMRITQRSSTTINGYIQRLGLKPVKKNGRTNLYSKSCIDLINTIH